MSAARGTATATPERAATSRACSIRSPSPRSWSRSGSGPKSYATQPEILRYLEHVADRFDLRRDVRTSTRVDSLQFDEDRGRWLVRTDTGAELDAQFCIIATGCLSVPKMPEIPGVSSFRGMSHHTAQWPHDGVDFTGLRVGVIGTGSSGLQSIPLIAEQAAALTVFQRTPVYTTPALNRPLEAADVEPIKAAYDELRELTRTSPFGVPALPSTRSALEVDADERERVYEDAYQVGHLFAVPYSFADIQITQEANDTAAEFLRGKIRSLVADPAVAELLCPTDYPYACKRPCLDTGYYETFNRDNVKLVDLRATPITRIVPAGVETTAGLHELDAIVYATGFDAITGALAAIDIRGRGGLALADKWATGWRTLPRSGRRRVPEFVHRNRSGQPIGDQQRDRVHRAARRLDHRRPHHGTVGGQRRHRGHRGRRARLGQARRRSR